MPTKHNPKLTMEKVRRFVRSRLYGDEKYSLNGMEIKSYRMPLHPGNATSVWADVITSEWYEIEGQLGISSTDTGDAWWNGVPDHEFLLFAKEIGKLIKFNAEVTGARIVRYTHLQSGYPVLRMDLATTGTGVLNYLPEPNSDRNEMWDEPWNQWRKIPQY